MHERRITKINNGSMERYQKYFRTIQPLHSFSKNDTFFLNGKIHHLQNSYTPLVSRMAMIAENSQ